MNKYRVKGKAKQATQLILTCIIWGLCFWAAYGIVKVFSSSSVPVSVALTGPGHIKIEDGQGFVMKDCTFGYTFDDLLDAIEWVESNGEPSAIGDNGKAVGSFQIHKIYVDDVNRIMMWLSHTKTPTLFTYDDRYDRTLSRQMVTIYLVYYGGTFEEMARRHNGGPTGHKKKSTKPYWAKVQARLVAKEIK